MEQSKEFNLRVDYYKKARNMSSFYERGYLVLSSSGQYKVECLDNVVLDRETVLAGETELVYVAFPSTLFSNEQIQELVKVQLKAEGVSI